MGQSPLQKDRLVGHGAIAAREDGDFAMGKCFCQEMDKGSFAAAASYNVADADDCAGDSLNGK